MKDSSSDCYMVGFVSCFLAIPHQNRTNYKCSFCLFTNGLFLNWAHAARTMQVHLPNFDFCHSFIVMTPKWHLFCCTFKIIVAFHFNKVQWSTFNFKRPYFQVSPREEFFFDTIIILLLTYMIITYVISSFYKSYSLIKPTYIIFSEYDYRCLLQLVRLGSDKKLSHMCTIFNDTVKNKANFFQKSQNILCTHDFV